MKIELTYENLYDVFGACQSTLEAMMNNKQKGNGKFLNFLFNNRDRSRDILLPIEKKRPIADDKLKEYTAKTQEFIGSNPSPMAGLKPGEQPDPEKMKAFEAKKEEINKSLEALREEYKDTLDEWKKKTDKFNEELQKKVQFEPAVIKEENLPSEIAVDVMEIFYRFVINK